MLHFESEDHTSHYKMLNQYTSLTMLRTHEILIDHKGTNSDLDTLDSATLDEGVLLIKVSHKTGPVMASVAFRGKDKPIASRKNGSRSFFLAMNKRTLLIQILKTEVSRTTFGTLSIRREPLIQCYLLCLYRMKSQCR